MKALILSGGGAGGAFQIGVLKRLFENGDHFNVIYGTSVGALNGSALAFMDFEKLFGIWMGLKEDSVLTRNWLAFIGFGGLYSANKLHKMIDEHITGSPRCEVKVTYVDHKEGTLHFAELSRLPLEEFKKFVKASSAVPFYMSPVDGRFVDGGVREHTPMIQAIKDGFRDITVIACNEAATEEHLKGWKPSWPYNISHGLRANDLLQREVFVNDILVPAIPNLKVRMFSPQRRIISTFEFVPEKIRAAIAQGYQTEGLTWA